MTLEIYQLALIALITIGASYVQTVTGFAFGIVAMIFLPSLLAYAEANVLSTALSTLTSVLIVRTTYKNIDWKNLAFPLSGSFAANYLAISFVKSAKNETLTLILGVALFALSIYFFFFSDSIKIKPTWYSGLTAGILSGLMSGLFSIGGPPVVVYYLQSEEDVDRYLATLSAYFVFSGVISTTMKAASGFVTSNVLAGFALGVFGMIAGSLLGKKSRDQIDSKKIKRAVYGVMAVSGVINVITSLL